MTSRLPIAALRRVGRRLRTIADVVFLGWWLTVVEVGVRTLPLPRLASVLGVQLSLSLPPDSGSGPPERGGSRADFSPAEQRRVRILGRLGPHWPFAKGPCLREALVAGHLLRRHRPVLYIGALIDGDDVVGHAWLEVGAVTIGAVEGFATLASAHGNSPAVDI